MVLLQRLLVALGVGELLHDLAVEEVLLRGCPVAVEVVVGHGLLGGRLAQCEKAGGLERVRRARALVGGVEEVDAGRVVERREACLL